ncbi:LuxR C-terminal-related transcriptional regulator [Kitasatospora sp. CB01950]|uniref:LuxR C-terminal-related transcriptional regulator n=1 Tax=Kitasatospora sp. CB01950 TaxID=1703930 RepID=UPI00093D6075|nr:LuxR C-terminal-related transcriptional regulator [Kitasatospora sp. CB01950]
MTSPSTAEPERTTGDSPSDNAQRLLRRLTPREAQALARLAAGDDLRTLARRLGIAPGAARAHLNRAMRKLGAASHEEAAALAAALARPPGPPAAARPKKRRKASPDPATDDTPSTAPAPPRPPVPETAPETVEAAPPDAPSDPSAPEPAAEAEAEAESEAESEAEPEAVPVDFAEFAALVHTRLVQQTFLLTGHRHRALHCVHLALGAAGRRWEEVSATADPEGRVRSAAFDLALSPWHRGGPRRARVLRARRRIKVAEPVVPEPPTRLTPRDRALLKALQRLSRPRRRALVLHDTLGLSVEQLALDGESSTAAAEARVRSARASLAREVPALVGADPDDPEFAERLAELLHRAAVHGCPGPRLPSPALLVADSRLHTGLLTGAAAALTVVVGTAVATTLLGVGPADLLRPVLPAATACTAAGSGSAGPAAAEGAPGLRTPWCGASPGSPTRLIGPPARVLPSVQPSDDADEDADSADALPVPSAFGVHRSLPVPLPGRRPLPPPLANACVPLAHCRTPGV